MEVKNIVSTRLCSYLIVRGAKESIPLLLHVKLFPHRFVHQLGGFKGIDHGKVVARRRGDRFVVVAIVVARPRLLVAAAVCGSSGSGIGPLQHSPECGFGNHVGTSQVQVVEEHFQIVGIGQVFEFDEGLQRPRLDGPAPILAASDDLTTREGHDGCRFPSLLQSRGKPDTIQSLVHLALVLGREW